MRRTKMKYEGYKTVIKNDIIYIIRDSVHEEYKLSDDSKTMDLMFMSEFVFDIIKNRAGTSQALIDHLG